MKSGLIRSLARCAALMLVLLSLPVHAERIKDITSVAGVRDNPLLGYGLVVGLDGTGDQVAQAAPPFCQTWPAY